MDNTMLGLCEYVNTCVFGYTSSDEISIVLRSNNKSTFQKYRLQKLCSMIAARATLEFNKSFRKIVGDDEELLKIYGNSFDKFTFDARAFNIPRGEVIENIIWRQKYSILNSRDDMIRYLGKCIIDKPLAPSARKFLEIVEADTINNIPARYKYGASCYREFNGDNNRTWRLERELSEFENNRAYLEELIFKGVKKVT